MGKQPAQLSHTLGLNSRTDLQPWVLEVPRSKSLQGSFLLRHISWLADGCVLCVLTWSSSACIFVLIVSLSPSKEILDQCPRSGSNVVTSFKAMSPNVATMRVRVSAW